MGAKKIIFLGSKPIGYQCFEHLIAQREALGVEIIGLLSNVRTEFGEGHDLTQLAEQNNIPVIADLDQMPECDILYSVQYHRILKAHDINKARQLAVNLHMAPLPEYRGSNQFSFAIIDQKEEFGTTIHVMDPRIDHGDILFQKRFKIPKDCWVDDLYQLTFKASVSLFKQTLAHVIGGQYTPVSQASLVNRFGTSLHYRHEMADIKVIDLDWPADQIERYVRATSMPGFEPPYCRVAGRKVYMSLSN
jgi:methionyl-tRNA formyltransferase